MIDRHPPSEDVFQIVTSGAAIVTNFVLLVLIQKKSPSSLGGYKYLMMYIAVFELFYATFDVIFLPYMYSSGSGFLVILDPYWDLPKDLMQFLDYVFCGSFGMLMSIFAIHFVFRYLVVSGNKTWTSKSTGVVAVWISIPLIVGFSWSIVAVLFMGKNDISDKVIAEQIQADVAYVGPFFDYSQGTAHNFHVYCGLILMVLIGVLCFFSTMYFGSRCFFEVRALTKDSTKSYTYKSLQAQLFYVLVAQSMIPFLFVFLPAAVLAITIYNSWSNDTYGKVLTLSNAIYPVLDPLPNMLMIKSYRDALFGCCSRRKMPSRNRIVSSNNTSFISEPSLQEGHSGNSFISVTTVSEVLPA